MKPGSRNSRGFTLIDVLVLIVLISTVAGSMTVLFSRLSAQSAETLRARQQLALAQLLLDEVRMMPMTTCDAQDANARTAASAANCTGGAAGADAIGPEPGETRYGVIPADPARQFDSVGDYSNFVMPAGAIRDIAGNVLNPPGSPLAGCNARISTVPQAMPGVAATDVHGLPQALRIVVRLRCPPQADTVVEAVRMRHAPNTP